MENSISRTYSLKIFDIVKSFENTKEFYKEKCALPIYEKNFLPLEMRHYYWQMSKYKFFPKDKQKEIIDYFTECIRNTEIHFYNFSLEDMFIYMKFQVKKHLYKYLI